MLIRRLTPADAAAYRAVMLEGYAEESPAFTSTVEERGPLPLDWWTTRLSDREHPNSTVFAAIAGDEIGGVAGLARQDRDRTRHKALLFGMYVRPPDRGRGAGRRLVEAVIAEAEAIGVRALGLTVRASNTPARRLYEACGFETFGIEPRALRTERGFADQAHMWRPIDPQASR